MNDVVKGFLEERKRQCEHKWVPVDYDPHWNLVIVVCEKCASARRVKAEKA